MNLDGSVEPIYNAVDIVELADALATKVTVIFYADSKDALLKVVSE